MKIYVYVFLFSLMVWVSHACAADTYRFVGTTFPLILQNGPDGKLEGVSVDIINDIAQEQNFNFSIEILPWQRALSMVKNGQADVLIGPYKSEEREKFMSFSTSHFYEDRMVFLRTSHLTFHWDGNFNAVKSLKILTIKSWAYGKRFDDHRADLKIEETIYPDHALKMLQKGRADLLAFNERNAIAEIKKNQLENTIIICEPSFSKAKGYFGFSKIKQTTDLQNKFNMALDTMLANGTITEHNARYGLNFQNTP